MKTRLPGLALACALASGALFAQEPAKPGATATPEYPDFYTGESGKAPKGIDFVQAIKVSAPAYCSEIQGDTTVTFQAPGMTQAKAFCWQQPPPAKPTPPEGLWRRVKRALSGGEPPTPPAKPSPWGHDAAVADLKLAADGNGSFVFPADQFPNGPITIRIHAKDEGKKQDICELQLFNRGGVAWNQGIPKADPPAAKGLKLLFADDFAGPLSISPDGKNARYPAHKTGGGDFSGWIFSDPAGENDPFGQAGTWLRIHASKKPGTKGRSGILSSIRGDGSGVSALPPCYFECRFVAQSAPGTWPAFWTLTKGTIGMDKAAPEYEAVKKAGGDELDIIEAYGGYGPKNPNSGGNYCIVSHFWNQPKPAWHEPKGADGKPNPLYKPHSAVVDTLALGGKSSWSWTFHTYGLLITETDTVYYFDGSEVLRHPTGPVSKTQPTWFLVNYAIGGISGWQIDLERYGNQSDMWVDYIRVYSGRTQMPDIVSSGFPGAKPAAVTISCVTEGAPIHYTTDDSEPTENSPRYQGPIAISKACTVKAKAFGKDLKPSSTAKHIITAAPGVAGSIGINFVTAEGADQTLAANDIAGIGPEAQGNWNAVSAEVKTASGFITSDGAPSPVTLSIEGEAKPATGEPWGFGGNDLKLKRGNLVSNPRLVIKGIPYAKYDVIVILGAGIHNVQGEVSLAPLGSDTPSDAFSFDYGWNGGKHAVATTKPGETPKNMNYIVFKGATAPDIAVTMKWLAGKGWTGISALQIIPRQ
jgi:hypothetical protein